MSRGSIGTFLRSAKAYLRRVSENKERISFVIGNESADLDSITSALLYGYIQSSQTRAKKSGEITIPVTAIPAADLALRPELTALLKHAGIKPSELITLDDLSLKDYPKDRTQWVLVDHNVFLGPLGKLFSSQVVGVIDHHEDEQHVPATVSPRIITKSGSCTSLITNHFRPAWEAISSAASSVGAAHGQDDKLIDDVAYTSTWDAQAATLALGSVLIDTANMQDKNKVTEHDRRALRYLEALVHASPKLGKDYDRDSFFTEIDTARSDLDGLTVYDILRKDYKEWGEGNMTLGVAAVVRPLEYLWGKEDDFNRTLVRFARDRSLPLFAIMTAYTSDGGEFARQLLLVAMEDGEARKIAEHFVTASGEELQLEELEYEQPAEAVFAHAWTQQELSASRKQVAPLLRQAMRSSKVSAKC